MNALTTPERRKLKALETIIQNGLDTFVEVGTALLKIRDGRLYRMDHKTFDDYCREHWKMSHRRANQLIGASEVVANLGTVVPKLPNTERQARPLAALEPAQQIEAWQRVIETAGNKGITARDVQSVVDRYAHKASVTYKSQPSIDAAGGSVPLAGTSHIYTVSKLLWPEAVEEYLTGLLVGRTLHLCCGESQLGDVRLDNDPAHAPDVMGDAAHTDFENKSFGTVLCDPPYDGDFQWNHDLLTEMARLASRRIVFQHWFIPADDEGFYKKSHVFRMASIAVWQPRTYFGRAQLISVFDSAE